MIRATAFLTIRYSDHPVYNCGVLYPVVAIAIKGD
jgi:hypothetical protein